MEIKEAFKSPDQKKKIERYDVRKEAEKMIHRHSDALKKLRNTSLSQEAFREAALQATDQFTEKLKAFLQKNGAEDLYEELVGYTSGKVSEVVSSSRDKKD